MEKCERFAKPREIFRRIRSQIEDADNKECVKEFEEAVEKLVSSYNTRNHENRFVVGGALEILFCALLRSLGFECEWLRELRYDLKIDGQRFSIKSNFTGRGTMRLINVLGKGTVEWAEPTLFFIGGHGIFYADPCMGLPTKRTGDALIIDTREVLKIEEPWKIKINVPIKPKDPSHIRTASYDVAKSVLEQIGSVFLKEYLPPA